MKFLLQIKFALWFIYTVRKFASQWRFRIFNQGVFICYFDILRG